MARSRTASGHSSAFLSYEVKRRLAADKLRSNRNAAEYQYVVLGLIFLKYISDTFEGTVAPLFVQMRTIQNQSRTLATLRDTLLPKLLSGELSTTAAMAIIKASP